VQQLEGAGSQGFRKSRIFGVDSAVEGTEDGGSFDIGVGGGDGFLGGKIPAEPAECGNVGTTPARHINTVVEIIPERPRGLRKTCGLALPSRGLPSRALPSRALPSRALPSRGLPSRDRKGAVPTGRFPQPASLERSWGLPQSSATGGILTTQKPEGQYGHFGGDSRKRGQP
jgi:hypothetical protein